MIFVSHFKKLSQGYLCTFSSGSFQFCPQSSQICACSKQFNVLDAVLIGVGKPSSFIFVVTVRAKYYRCCLHLHTEAGH